MSDSVEIVGQIVEIFDEVELNGGHKKREFVVETEGNYPQLLKVELFGDDKVGLIDKYKEGETIKAHCNLRGRKYEHPEKGDMYFLSLGAWRIEGEVAGDTPPADDGGFPPPDPNDNLPF